MGMIDKVDIVSKNLAKDCMQKNEAKFNKILSDAYIEGFKKGVEKARRSGLWMSDPNGFWVCSACKFPSEAFAAPVLYKYCPNCGAMMDTDSHTE